MWIVEIERVLRVRYLGLGPVYLYPYRWLKHHLLALMVVSMCPLVAMPVTWHCPCIPSSRVSYASRFDNSSDSTTYDLGSRAPPWYLQALHRSVPATHV